MDPWTLESRQPSIACFLGVALCLVLGTALLGEQADASGGVVLFEAAVDLNGDGCDEVVVGLAARSEPHVAEFAAPGDVFVYERGQDNGFGGDLQQVFRCRAGIPQSDLSGFYRPSLVSIADLDGDSLPEIVLVWDEQCWWPTAYRPLSILQFDPASGSYELVIDTTRAVSEIGGYAITDVDDDGTAEILEIDPVYGTEMNPASGVEEPECHYCPHRYGVRVLEFDGLAFRLDVDFNNGKRYVTPDKLLPIATWDPLSSFLPVLLTQVRSIGQEQPSECCD